VKADTRTCLARPSEPVSHGERHTRVPKPPLGTSVYQSLGGENPQDRNTGLTTV